MDKVRNMIGLAKKAGRLEVGEEPVGAAARARDARLILVASDAADNSVRRVRHFADAGQCIWEKIPITKDDLGRAVGRTSCAMVAVTDIGFASAIGKKLAEYDERYAITAEKLDIKAQRAAQRRAEAEAHEKNVRMGKKKSEPKEEAAKEAPAPKKSEPKAMRAPKPSREERRRSAAKRAARERYADAKPVKRGKGSIKKEKQ